MQHAVALLPRHFVDKGLAASFIPNVPDKDFSYAIPKKVAAVLRRAPTVMQGQPGECELYFFVSEGSSRVKET